MVWWTILLMLSLFSKRNFWSHCVIKYLHLSSTIAAINCSDNLPKLLMLENLMHPSQFVLPKYFCFAICWIKTFDFVIIFHHPWKCAEVRVYCNTENMSKASTKSLTFDVEHLEFQNRAEALCLHFHEHIGPICVVINFFACYPTHLQWKTTRTISY